MSPPTSKIRQIFTPLSIQGQQAEFFNHVADDVHWTILGHSPMSGVYTSKAEFQKHTLSVLRNKVLTEPLRLRVVNVVGGGGGSNESDSDWVAVEMEAIDAKCKNGLTYDMVYCWNVKFNDKDIITVARAYIDTKLLTDAMGQNP